MKLCFDRQSYVMVLFLLHLRKKPTKTHTAEAASNFVEKSSNHCSAVWQTSKHQNTKKFKTISTQLFKYQLYSSTIREQFLTEHI